MQRTNPTNGRKEIVASSLFQASAQQWTRQTKSFPPCWRLSFSWEEVIYSWVNNQEEEWDKRQRREGPLQGKVYIAGALSKENELWGFPLWCIYARGHQTSGNFYEEF
jgi:hypothetical protein